MGISRAANSERRYQEGYVAGARKTREEMQAEIERLQWHAKHTEALLKAQSAELERRRELRQSYRKQHAEIMRLRIKCSELFEARINLHRLREAIALADNRLEVADCPACVDVARSYLREALAADEEKP